MTEHQATALIIAEDNPRDREFLARLLTAYAVTFASNGEEALRVAAHRPAPWVISDLQMPAMNGIDFAKRLWADTPDARIVFWSQHKDEVYVRALAKIIPAETVYGYVLKDNPSQIIEKAVHAVFHDCQCWIDPQIRPVQARSHAAQSTISDLEYEVLVDIALGLTDHMIAKRRYLSRRGAQNRLKSLYQKLGIDQEPTGKDTAHEAVNMRARAVSVALRRGLLNTYELEQEEEKMQHWLSRQPH